MPSISISPQVPPAVRPRPRARAAGRHARRGAAPQPGAGAARRGARLHALLGRRAPQHDRHRQRGHGGGHRLPRARHVADPRRLGRHHAAQPLAAGDRRAVRHAGVAVSGPHRLRPRPRARHRPGDGARTAPRSARRRELPRGRAGTAGAVPAGAPGPDGAGRARRRPRRAAVDPRLQHLRRATGRRAGPALRVRVALRARGAHAGDGAVPPACSSRRSNWTSRTRWPAST
jgi:hypothetical protein